MTTAIKKVRTNSKEVKTAIQNYILSAIDTDGQFNHELSIEDQLTFICSEFKRVAGYKNNIKHHGTYQQCFIDWFQGMPSYFNIEVYNTEILLLMASFGLPLPDNKDESEGVQLFNNLIFINFVDLCKKFKVDFWAYCNNWQ